jgi:hypothetical protein
MKSFLVFLGSILSISTALAAPVSRTSSEENFDLAVQIPGEYRFEVLDARGSDVVLSLRQDASVADPEIKVADQFGSFECELSQSVQMIDAGTKEFTVSVNWFPGADYSGCIVEFKNPETKDVATVEVYMSY